jgi:hypothetical protein
VGSTRVQLVPNESKAHPSFKSLQTQPRNTNKRSYYLALNIDGVAIIGIALEEHGMCTNEATEAANGYELNGRTAKGFEN